MEYAATKPSKPSSNISEMVSKFAKVCKLRSIGVLHNEDGSDSTEKTESDDRKIYPHFALVSSKSDLHGEDYILQLFDAVSAFKLHYIQLQEAHVPYNPDKIIAADDHIVTQLKALRNIRQMYKEKKFIFDEPDSSLFESELQKLKSINSSKDEEIVNLRSKLQDLDLGNAALVEKMRERSFERKDVRGFSISMFEDTFQKALKSIHDFAKPLISLMKACGWDLDQAANSIESGIFYSKRSHMKHTFEAYIARKMFQGNLVKSCNIDDVMKFDDPFDSLIENPNSGFSDFCRKKYLFIVHPVMEMSFFGNLDQRMFLLSGKHPRTPFYQIFARMAKWIWVLPRIAKAIDPEAEIFALRKGTKFSDVYMASVETDVPDRDRSELKVQFMVMPGFRIGNTLIRSRVYLSDTKPSLHES